MSAMKRLYNIIIAILMLIMTAVLFIFSYEAIYFVYAITIISLTIHGIKQIIYYFMMARHMVGGRNILYRGIIVLDTGLFLLLVADDPKIYVVMYLIGGLALSGAISILRGIESRKLKVKSWKIAVLTGVIKLAIAGTSLFCYKSVDVIVYIFAVGLFYSALVRIVEAFRKSAIIFVQ